MSVYRMNFAGYVYIFHKDGTQCNLPRGARHGPVLNFIQLIPGIPFWACLPHELLL